MRQIPKTQADCSQGEGGRTQAGRIKKKDFKKKEATEINLLEWVEYQLALFWKNRVRSGEWGASRGENSKEKAWKRSEKVASQIPAGERWELGLQRWAHSVLNSNQGV